MIYQIELSFRYKKPKEVLTAMNVSQSKLVIVSLNALR